MKDFVMLTITEDEIETRVAISIKSIIAIKEGGRFGVDITQVWISGNPEQRFFEVDQSIDKIIDLIDTGQKHK